MSLFIQLIIVLQLLIVWLLVRENDRKKLKRRYVRTIFGAVTKPLIKIHLGIDPLPDWIKDNDVQPILEDFKSLGFTSGRSYVLREVNGMKLHSLFLDDFVAMVVKHPTEGTWAEVCFLTESGRYFIVTNSPIGDESRTHDKISKTYQRETTPIGLYNLLKQRVVGRFPVNVSNDNFKSVIEEYYLKELCWKNTQGGITIHEFKQNIRNNDSEIKISKNDLRKIFLEMKVEELHQWHNACIEEYRGKTDQLSRKFDYLDYALFIVPKRTISQAYIQYLSNFEVIDKNLKDRLADALRKKTDTQKIFEIINNAFSEESRACFVDELEYPLNAKIFRRADKAI